MSPAPWDIKVPRTVSGRKKSSECFSIVFSFIASTNLFRHFELVDSQQQDHFACHFPKQLPGDFAPVVGTDSEAYCPSIVRNQLYRIVRWIVKGRVYWDTYRHHCQWDRSQELAFRDAPHLSHSSFVGGVGGGGSFSAHGHSSYPFSSTRCTGRSQAFRRVYLSFTTAVIHVCIPVIKTNTEMPRVCGCKIILGHLEWRHLCFNPTPPKCCNQSSSKTLLTF